MMKVVCGGNPDLLLNLVSITQCNVSMPYFFLGGIGELPPTSRVVVHDIVMLQIGARHVKTRSQITVVVPPA